MNSINSLPLELFPPLLKEIPKPPSSLNVRGTLPSYDNVFLTVVGARRYSDYGKKVTEDLIASLKGLPVVIVSGLAFGIDAIAHRAALDAGLQTIAVPGSGLNDDVLYPRDNKALAEEIVGRGGALVSHFDNDVAAAPWTFPHRNRIMAGLSHATLVIEAEIKSGTLITSKFAGDFSRNVLAVPGSIFNSKSDGPHMLIRLGATPITSGKDLIEALGFNTETQRLLLKDEDLSDDEKLVLLALEKPLSRDELFAILDLETNNVSIALSLLEIKGYIEELLGTIRKKS